MIEIRPQPGPQEQALASDADIVLFGGSNGGGKSWALLLSVAQHASFPRFGAEIFRRTFPELTMTGGLWPESFRLFGHLGGEPKQTTLEWSFPSGARVKFSHMQHENDRYNWDGAQIPMVGFDQLESFTAVQFWHLLSRNRDPAGQVRPFMFGTCNPVPEDDLVGGWLHRLIQWWVDPASGLAIDERSGAVRWMVRDDLDVIHWASTREELVARFPKSDPKSLTFIRSLLEDNPELERADPGYRGRLELLPAYERARRLGANWNARPEAGKVFDRAKFKAIAAAPRQARRVRAWDKAGTEDGGDWTAGVRMAEADGLYYVEGCVRGQWGARSRTGVIGQVTLNDGYEVAVWLEQEPGSGGKESAELSVRQLAGYDARAEPVTGSKLARAGAFAAQVEGGNVYVVVSGDPARDAWVEPYLAEHHAFDGSGAGHDDQVDASSLAFNKLALQAGGLTIGALGSGEGAGAPARAKVEIASLFKP